MNYLFKAYCRRAHYSQPELNAVPVWTTRNRSTVLALIKSRRARTRLEQQGASANQTQLLAQLSIGRRPDATLFQLDFFPIRRIMFVAVVEAHSEGEPLEDEFIMSLKLLKQTTLPDNLYPRLPYKIQFTPLLSWSWTLSRGQFYIFTNRLFLYTVHKK